MTLLYTHPSGHLHATPPGHPEQVARLDAVLTALDGLEVDRRAAPAADDADILRGHAPEYLAALERRTPDRGWSMLDADTALSPDSRMLMPASESTSDAMQATLCRFSMLQQVIT
ncbi:hypothetical protein ACFOMH_08280 [Paracoccus mangrovi]|uniref:Histone deacetylase domain-containing protein n=1 Tax=Paracoccus mangrovi TaxID=1715645 RepID=A0ABV7R5Z6_9RHOB